MRTRKFHVGYFLSEHEVHGCRAVLLRVFQQTREERARLQDALESGEGFFRAALACSLMAVEFFTCRVVRFRSPC